MIVGACNIVSGVDGWADGDGSSGGTVGVGTPLVVVSTRSRESCTLSVIDGGRAIDGDIRQTMDSNGHAGGSSTTILICARDSICGCSSRGDGDNSVVAVVGIAAPLIADAAGTGA